MQTPLWDIDPFPTLIFDPDIERATRLSVRSVEGGVPVENATSADDCRLSEHAYKQLWRIAAGLDPRFCLAKSNGFATHVLRVHLDARGTVESDVL